jgi:hypothetical protein
MTQPDSPRPFDFAGNIQQGKLPPDLDTAYRGAFWGAQTANLILEYSQIYDALSRERAAAGEESPCPEDEFIDAFSSLFPPLVRWLFTILESVISIADEILLARGTADPVRCGNRSADSFHALGAGHADLVCICVVSALRASDWPSQLDDANAFAETLSVNLQAVVASLAGVERLPDDFYPALRSEALAKKLSQLQRQPITTAPHVAVNAPSANNTKSMKRQKLKEPSKEAITCYRLSITVGQKQEVLANILAEELGRPVDQSTVSRWIKRVREWLRAGNVLPDLTPNNGPKPRTVPMDPANIDRGAGRTESIRRQSKDSDSRAELDRLIAEQQAEDDYDFEPIRDEDD